LVNADTPSVSSFTERDLLYSLLNQPSTGVVDPNADIFNWLQQSVDTVNKQPYQSAGIQSQQSVPMPPDIYDPLMKATIPSALGIKRERESSSDGYEIPGLKFNPSVFSLEPTVLGDVKTSNNTESEQTPSKKIKSSYRRERRGKS